MNVETGLICRKVLWRGFNFVLLLDLLRRSEPLKAIREML